MPQERLQQLEVPQVQFTDWSAVPVMLQTRVSQLGCRVEVRSALPPDAGADFLGPVHRHWTQLGHVWASRQAQTPIVVKTRETPPPPPLPGVSAEVWPFFSRLFARRPWRAPCLLHAARAPRGGDGSDGCAQCIGTSGRPSQWNWRRPCITAVMWGLLSTSAYRHRRPPTQLACGQESLRTLDRGVRRSTSSTPPCGDRCLRLQRCRRWPRCSCLARRPMGSTPPPSASSRRRLWPGGRRRLRQTFKKEFLELCGLGSQRSSLQTGRMQELTDILDFTEHPAGIFASSAGTKRKRKQRKKKKLPRGGFSCSTSSCSSGACGKQVLQAFTAALGGDLHPCVRHCRQVERLHWWCHVRQAPR